MPEMYLRQPAVQVKSRFTHTSCTLFTKNKERMEVWKKKQNVGR